MTTITHFEFQLIQKVYDTIKNMTGGLFELAIVVLIAAVLGIVAKLLKQPIVLAYLATGISIGYFGFFNIQNGEVFSIFSDLGIMFLLFLVGLEINYTSLRLVGKTSLAVGLGQIIVTALFGYFISTGLGFIPLHAAYIAIALTFSSTVIVVKLLSDNGDSNSLYGKISIGILLVQDIIAIAILILLAGVKESEGVYVWESLAFMILKGVILFAVIIWLGRKFFPPLFDRIARSQELLFLASLAWLFLLAAIVSKIGFSIEIAGFLAGLALANSSEHFEISHRIRSLRDFFILIFFVILGSSAIISNFAGLAIPIIVLSLFVLIGNPLIVLIIMGLMGHRRRTSFMTGVTIAQVSEFSLVLAALGLKLGHVTDQVVTLITSVAIITIALSTYLIMYGEKLYRRCEKVLKIFEKKKVKGIEYSEWGEEKSIVLIGCHRTGESIAFGLPRNDLLIIDFDPDVIKKLKAKGYEVIYGDANDDEVLHNARVEDAKLVISTSPVLEDNITLIKKIRALSEKPKLVLRADTEHGAKVLYGHGADYVLLPNFTAGQYLGKTISLSPEMEILSHLKENDIALMKRIDA